MDSPIRVLCVFSSLDRGGAESMCMNLYRNIDREVIQFDFVQHGSHHGAFEEEITALGGRIFTAPKYHGYNHFAYRKWWKKHFQAHPEHQIIHCHYFTFAKMIHSVAIKYDRCTIAHSHFTYADRLSKKILVYRLENNIEYCFACGREAGEWIYPHRDFTVLNNAIESEKFRYNSNTEKTVREELGLTGRFTVGVVGRMVEFKNPMETISIFKEIANQRPNACLVWLGDGNMREAISVRMKEEGIEDSVMLLGVRKDVSRILQCMDVYLQPSFAEGLSVAQIEAQAAGIWCFVSDQITKEADITGRCTYLPLGQPKLWADTVLSTNVTKEDTWQQVVDAGYDIKTTSRWLQEFYLGVSKEKEQR